MILLLSLTTVVLLLKLNKKYSKTSMKNLLTKSLALVFGLGVAATFTACHNGEDAQPTVVTNVSVQETDENGNVVGRTLVITANKTATFTLGSETKSGTNVTFTNAPVKGTVSATAGSTTKKVKFNFGDAKDLAYDVIFESEGTAVTQAAAQAGTTTVSNQGANADETGVTAEMDFSGGVTNADATVTGDYSVTVVTPTEAETSAEELESKKGQTDAIQEPVLSLDCKPDGAKFTAKPVKVKVYVPNSADYELACVNSENDDDAADSFVQKGDSLTIELSHFSLWDIILKATVVNVEKKTIANTFTGSSKDGSLAYTMNYGFDSDNSDAIVAKYLKKVFGINKREIRKRVTFSKVDGTAILNVTQQVKVYTIESGRGDHKKTFTATVYGKADLNLSVETNTPEEVKTHDGGSVRK